MTSSSAAASLQSHSTSSDHHHVAGPSRSSSVRSPSISSSRNGKGRAIDTEPALEAEHRREGDSLSSHDEEVLSEEEDEEPALKYSRIKGRIPEVLLRDTASAIEVTHRVIALGTHNGMVHLLTYEGAKVNSFRPHAASVTCLRLDEENDFVATASVEGRVVIHSLTTPESYAFDYKRPMRAVALEPGFAKKTTRAFVCGGMAGNLILQEKGWLGYKEQILHSGEGPIWAIEWRGTLIAWANDLGVKIYDTISGQRIGYIDRGAHSPRPELFKCSLLWKDDHTLVIGWADFVKIVRVRNRARPGNLPPMTVEMTAIYQVDCMISGIAVHGSSFVILAYVAPDSFENEATDDPVEQRRKAANRPELRIIDKGEEVSADALSLNKYYVYGCNDYSLVKSRRHEDEAFFVVSPSDVVVVRPRDEADHIQWLVERQRYEEALTSAESLQRHGDILDIRAIGVKYMEHLVAKGDYSRAANLSQKVLGDEASLWEDWLHKFAQYEQLSVIANSVPVDHPRLDAAVYEMILGHLLLHDRACMVELISAWPPEIYDGKKIMGAVQGELEATKNDPILLRGMAELLLKLRQPAKALPYYIRLRRPETFDLIREYNLFAALKDQALSLVQFDQDVGQGAAIDLLVDNTHSIPIEHVVHQLETDPRLLHLYLDALFVKDPQSCAPYNDTMVGLYAAHDPEHLMPFLRASNYYDLEKAYNICHNRDLVPEMVFLLGRMGNNREALMLIIERLGDVQRAIDFAKEQADEDLWEDLLRYSDTRPDFMRALLEHVGSEINPIRLIQRIRDGLEIPGLKPALIKILQSSNLQISLLEGSQHILESDCSALANRLQSGQTGSVRASLKSNCQICGLPAFPPTANSALAPLNLIYLCRHLVHAACALLNEETELPLRPDPVIAHLLSSDGRRSRKTQQRDLSSRLSYAAAIRVRVGGCPVCAHSRPISA
ncbi:hypothetical protein BCR39DRAFT_563909 [Naematelia encephala]|uniref:Vacuolar protein sorting-associated protein 41 n=1 Tax=Naematelia encephala TaxID=71784 RepID=A0A1Y2BF93_9TREE|nr:hypothetical protein BCR39DRAFT_563909 [Naematelia encephala]